MMTDSYKGIVETVTVVLVSGIDLLTSTRKLGGHIEVNDVDGRLLGFHLVAGNTILQSRRGAFPDICHVRLNMALQSLPYDAAKR